MITITFTCEITDYDRLPRITCKDGFSFSMQVGRGLYCTPRDNSGTYSKVELGFPSAEDDLIKPYAEIMDPENVDYTKTIYPYTPVGVVLKLIEKHGGIDPLKLLYRRKLWISS